MIDEYGNPKPTKDGELSVGTQDSIMGRAAPGLVNDGSLKHPSGASGDHTLQPASHSGAKSE